MEQMWQLSKVKRVYDLTKAFWNSKANFHDKRHGTTTDMSMGMIENPLQKLKGCTHG